MSILMSLLSEYLDTPVSSSMGNQEARSQDYRRNEVEGRRKLDEAGVGLLGPGQ